MQRVLETPSAGGRGQVTPAARQANLIISSQHNIACFAPEAPAAVACEVQEGCWGCSSTQTAAGCTCPSPQVVTEVIPMTQFLDIGCVQGSLAASAADERAKITCGGQSEEWRKGKVSWRDPCITMLKVPVSSETCRTT